MMPLDIGDGGGGEPLRASGEGGAPYASMGVAFIAFSRVYGWKPTESR